MQGFAFKTKKGLELWAPTQDELIELRLETSTEKDLLRSWMKEEYHIVPMTYDRFKEKVRKQS